MPVKEFQNLNGVEPYACVSYTMLTCVEALIKKKYSEDWNYSDRLLAALSGTKDRLGNDPKTVAETLRKKGGVLEDKWPFDAKTFEEYYKEVPQKLLELAKEFNDRWDFKYEYVDNDPASITAALKCSPLLISVPAWHKKDGKYYRPKGMKDNHATTLFYERVGDFRRVFDSYDSPAIKDIKSDAIPEVVMRFWIKKKPYEQQLSILSQILTVIGKWIGLIKPVDNPLTYIKKEPEMESDLRQKIHTEARKWLGKDASPQDNAPEELACAESVCNILQKTGVDIPLLVSTIELNKWLKNSPLFKQSLESKPGNIIISVTGTGNGSIRGHVGIFSDQWIMSNDSSVGMWLENYTIDGWVKRWRDKGGMAIYYYEAV